MYEVLDSIIYRLIFINVYIMTERVEYCLSRVLVRTDPQLHMPSMGFWRVAAAVVLDLCNVRIFVNGYIKLKTR